jgi:hypothetical protein
MALSSVQQADGLGNRRALGLPISPETRRSMEGTACRRSAYRESQTHIDHTPPVSLQIRYIYISDAGCMLNL